MTLRCALYARYSSDQQRATSIEDQFRVCRERAAREGWKVVGAYKDSAISGDSMILRLGIQALLEDARRGMFEILVAEALDRVSRDQADVATLYKHLRFAGVMIVTLSEGEIDELHVGLKGTMNALFLKDLAAKTHRGLRGRVEAGKSGGGLCYGYDVVKRHDAAGEPIRGERTVNETEAAIVRRVFREFASGASPRAIVRRLNGDGIPGPKGKLWTDTVLRGHAKRGTGLLNNELYIGRLVWNRQRFMKNPDTGKRVARINPPEEWIIAEVPELRILDDDLWKAAKARQGEISEKYATVIGAAQTARANRLNGAHRPRHLLSGLLECGVCGGSYAMRGQGRYGCSNHVMRGVCANGRSIRRSVIEERVLAGLKDKLMAPEVVAEAMRAYAEETNRINRERRASGASDRKELADVEKKIASIIAVIEDGGYVRGMVDRLRELEARQDELKEQLSAAPVDLPDIHPNIADIYRRRVARLAEALDHPEDRDAAASAIRGLIERIVLTPSEKWAEMDAVLHGDLGTILEWAGNGAEKKKTDTPVSGMSVSVVAGARFASGPILPRGARRCAGRRFCPSAGLLRRGRDLQAALDRRAAADRIEPALDVGKLVEVDLLPLVPEHPGPGRDVGDGIAVAGQMLPAVEPPVEHAVEPAHLRAVALDAVRHLLLCHAQEMVRLAEHRTNAAHLEHQPLDNLHPRHRRARQEPPVFLRQVDQDRAGFEHRDRFAGRPVRIDDRRDLAVRVNREIFRRELVALADMDRVEGIVRAQLLQHDRGLAAVRSGPGVQVDHGGVSVAVGNETAVSIARADRQANPRIRPLAGRRCNRNPSAGGIDKYSIYGIFDEIVWEVEYTDEFGDWWAGLSEGQQEDITAVVELLAEHGSDLRFPYSSGVAGSRHGHMRELRSQSAGRPVRVFFAFDPRRTAILLIGGDKTGDNRFYKRFVPLADRLYDDHLKELKDEGAIE